MKHGELLISKWGPKGARFSKAGPNNRHQHTKNHPKWYAHNEINYTNVIINIVPVSSMKRMVNQIGTHQDSPDLRKQL